MANLEAPRRGTGSTSGIYVLSRGTPAAVNVAVCLVSRS